MLYRMIQQQLFWKLCIQEHCKQPDVHPVRNTERWTTLKALPDPKAVLRQICEQISVLWCKPRNVSLYSRTKD